MKDLQEVELKELKAVIKELNESGLMSKKIKLVAISKEELVKALTDAVENLSEEAKVPQLVADFYNDLYADEMDEGEMDEGDDDEPEEEVNEEEEYDEEVNEDDDEPEEEYDDEDEPEEEVDENEEINDYDKNDYDEPEEEIKPPKKSNAKLPGKVVVEEPIIEEPIIEKKKRGRPKKNDPVKEEKSFEKKPEVKTEFKEVKEEVQEEEWKEKKKPVIKEKKKDDDNKPKKKSKEKIPSNEKVTNEVTEQVKKIFPTLLTKKSSYFDLDLITVKEIIKNPKISPKELYEIISKSLKIDEGKIKRESTKIISCFHYLIGNYPESKEKSKLNKAVKMLLDGEVPKFVHSSTVIIIKRMLLAYSVAIGLKFKESE